MGKPNSFFRKNRRGEWPKSYFYTNRGRNKTRGERGKNYFHKHRTGGENVERSGQKVTGTQIAVEIKSAAERAKKLLLQTVCGGTLQGGTQIVSLTKIVEGVAKKLLSQTSLWR